MQAICKIAELQHMLPTVVECKCEHILYEEEVTAGHSDANYSGTVVL